MIVRALKGLESAISVSVVHPTWGKTRPDDDSDEHHGWQFKDVTDPPVSNPAGYGSFDCKGCVPDFVNGVSFVRDLYDKVGYDGKKFTVPILWDKQTNTIVNNESSEIIRQFNAAFDGVCKNPKVDLYPSELREEIDAVNSWVYEQVNNGVYRCGFAQSQSTYDTAVEGLFSGLDRLEQILSKQRYLCGEHFTEADVRAFPTLIRFDEVYVVYFKCDRARIMKDYPHLSNYVREIYQMPGIADTVDMKHIKTHYFTSHPTLNKYAVIPSGPDVLNEVTLPHNREELFPLEGPPTKKAKSN